MKAFQPDCLGFYVPMKTFVAQHYHPPFVAELPLQALNGYNEFAAEHFQVNEGRRLTRSVNSGITSPRTTRCHSVPEDIQCFTVKSINVSAKIPFFSSYCTNVSFQNDLYTFYLYSHGDTEKPPGVQLLIAAAVTL